ncbi:MAG: lycopene cyclase domain protein [Frankiales bacterium]|nr:lycopene cyclase domain protein [Frankiales bacterium]
MSHLSYLAILLGCLAGVAPLEFLLGTGVRRRWRRLGLALLPGLVLGLSWDSYAVHSGQWRFAARYVLAPRLAGLPIEEVLFFVVVPTCAVLTLEAVRRRRPQWSIGDEPTPTPTQTPKPTPKPTRSERE